MAFEACLGLVFASLPAPHLTTCSAYITPEHFQASWGALT